MYNLEKYRLTEEETWEIYQVNGGRGIPPREQVNSVANAQLEALQPAIEEAKKEERERICNILRGLIEASDKVEEPAIKVKMVAILQALKPDESPSGVEE